MQPETSRILFVGNSHTQFHNLPELVSQMVRFLHPGKKTQARFIRGDFLDEVATNPECREALEAEPWTHMVLQAQKISQSGRFSYSKKEGIDLARLGKRRGAAVFFYSEWAVRGVPDHTARIEKIYREMAATSGGHVVPVGRAWELALTERPTLPLYDPDGNHQTALGAFLTACVLAGALSDKSPAPLSAFPYAKADVAERRFLAGIAARTLETKKAL